MLLVGADSYIGESFASYAAPFADCLHVDITATHNGEWQSHSFAGYDCVLQVAGLAHVKPRKSNKALYFIVNRDLAAAAAQKAKAAGVGQFIYLSSMAVYGQASGVITPDTLPAPLDGDWYAQSKYQAEQRLTTLQSQGFNVALVRPPMVYGPGCRGNYARLARLVRVLPLFPDIDNRRSVISIGNLCVFLRDLIASGGGGVHVPQDPEYAGTTRLAKALAATEGKSLRTTRLFNPFIRVLVKYNKTMGKLFGSLVYQPDTKD